MRIVNELGLHARAAAKIAKVAGDASAGVWIRKNDESVDAASIIDILTLSCAMGTEVTVAIDDPADAGILSAIETMIRDGFGE